MSLHPLSRWFGSSATKLRSWLAPANPTSRKRKATLGLESLEDRVVPATYSLSIEPGIGSAMTLTANSYSFSINRSPTATGMETVLSPANFQFVARPSSADLDTFASVMDHGSDLTKVELTVTEPGGQALPTTVESLILDDAIVNSLMIVRGSGTNNLPAQYTFSLSAQSFSMTTYDTEVPVDPISRSVRWSGQATTQPSTNDAALDFGQQHYQGGTTLDFGTGQILLSHNGNDSARLQGLSEVTQHGASVNLNANAGLDSPGLLTLLLDGARANEAVIIQRNNENQPLYAWTLSDLFVTSYTNSGSNAASPHDDFTLGVATVSPVTNLQHIPTVPTTGNIPGAPSVPTSRSTNNLAMTDLSSAPKAAASNAEAAQKAADATKRSDNSQDAVHSPKLEGTTGLTSSSTAGAPVYVVGYGEGTGSNQTGSTGSTSSSTGGALVYGGDYGEGTGSNQTGSTGSISSSAGGAPSKAADPDGVG
jgi:hypothetical protein